MKNRQRFFLFSTFLCLLIAFVLITDSDKLDNISKWLYNSSSENAKPTGGDFTLTAWNGSHSLHQYQGKVTLIYFGYTYCPDICPTDLANLAMAYQQLSPEQKEQVQILFVTVDPARDSAKRLQEYTHFFQADIIGLTGSADKIASVAKQYGVVYMKVDNSKNPALYTVDHSAFTYLVDKKGVLQTQLMHASPVDQIVKALHNFL